MTKKYTPFKMKGHTLPGINQRSEGNTDLPDGRSGSSPFQEKSPAKNYKNPQDYKVFNMGNEPTPVKMGGEKSPLYQSQAMKDKIADVTKTNLNIVNKIRRDQGKSELTDPNKKTNSKKKPAPTKLAPLVAMAGKAILGNIAGKVAGRILGGKKEEEE